jgi:WD40 repeat protein/serine/threonine protein kinase
MKPRADTLAAAAPDVTADEAHRRRKDLVRRRLLEDGPPSARNGRYTLLRQIGSGAMSFVHAAYDEELDRRVAIKLLRSPLTARDARLRREAKALAQVAHPNVVAVHDIGDWDGRLFIAMELVTGQTLDVWLRAGRRTWKQIVEVFLHAGRGLAAAHALGLVHRDFKPANVMVGDDGRPRVLDFGLVRLAEGAGADDDSAGDAARVEDPSADAGALTATGAHLGTPAYMAPEQRAGLAADARSDQYSFCVALHEALFGARPGATPAEHEARRERPVPARLARVIQRGLAWAPDARWPSMAHLLDRLERLRWPARRWRTRAAMLGTIGLVAIVAMAARHRVLDEQRARAALQQQAAHQRELAHDARLVAAAQRLIERDPTAAAAALREVRHPAQATGWRSTATAVLLEPLSRTIVRGTEGVPVRSVIHRDGSRVLSFLEDGKALLWQADGSGTPIPIEAEPGGTLVPSDDLEWVLTWKPGDPQVVLSRLDGGERRALGEPGERVAGAAFSGTGPEVLTVSQDGVVRLWGAGGSRVLSKLPLPPLARSQPPRKLGISPGGAFASLRTASGDHWLYSTRGTRPPLHVKTAGRRIDTVRFSRDGRWLVVALESGDLELWSTEAGGSPRVLRGHDDVVRGFDVSPDGRWLATASLDGTARIWPIEGSSEPSVLRGHTAPLWAVRFAPDGRRLVTTSRDRTARIWSLDGSGDVRVLRGHGHHVIAADFSPDGRRVLTHGTDPALRLWDIDRHPVRVLGRHDAEIWSASPDPGGRRLVTAGGDGTARIWSLDGARPPVVLRGHEHRAVNAAVFSPDGRRVATGASDGTARIWSADGSGEPIVLRGHRGWVYGLAFSPDGRLLATGSRDGEIRLTPVDGSGEPTILEEGHGKRTSSWVHSLVFGPGGDRLVADASAGSGSTPALLWTQGARRSVLGRPNPPQARIAVAMSPGGRIATGERGGSIRIWSPDGDGPLAILRGHGVQIHDLAFSRDGQRLLSASFDHSARLWDIDQPEPLRILRGHEDWVVQAVFDPGERRVVTASYDRTARVWHLDDPDHPIVLRGHEGAVRHAGFTPEGRVVTASLDGTVRLWSLDEIATDAPALMAQLRRATTACLTADQRMQYLDEPAAVAAARSADCERAMGRPPLAAAAAPAAPATAAPPGAPGARSSLALVPAADPPP